MFLELVCVYLRIERINEAGLHNGAIHKPTWILFVLVRYIVRYVGAKVDLYPGDVPKKQHPQIRVEVVKIKGVFKMRRGLQFVRPFLLARVCYFIRKEVRAKAIVTNIQQNFLGLLFVLDTQPSVFQLLYLLFYCCCIFHRLQ